MNATPDDIPNAPKYSLSAGIGYTIFKKLRLNADVQFVDRQYVQGIRSISSAVSQKEATVALAEVDDYLLFNLRVGYIIRYGGKLGELFVAVENLGDETYEYRPGYPMPGRIFTGGLNIRM